MLIEIVHIYPDLIKAYREYGDKQKEIAERIFELDNSTGVRYISGGLEKNFPDVPKDTLIIVGGAIWEICVQYRVEKLNKAGYSNVIADREIAFSENEI